MPAAAIADDGSGVAAVAFRIEAILLRAEDGLERAAGEVSDIVRLGLGDGLALRRRRPVIAVDDQLVAAGRLVPEADRAAGDRGGEGEIGPRADDREFRLLALVRAPIGLEVSGRRTGQMSFEQKHVRLDIEDGADGVGLAAVI